MKPFILVLSSPSGGGKSTIARALLTARENLGFSISATTRAPREGEKDGVDYHFLTREEFAARRERGEFLEWAEYSGNLYGTLESEVERVLGEGQHVVLDIEIEGARQVRQHRSDVASIFVLPPSADVLVERLVGRDQGGADTRVRARLERAMEEVREASEYDYVVVNDDRTQAVSEVAAIIDSESRRPSRVLDLEKQLADLQSGIGAIIENMEQ
ncbi:guanylate kinase [Gemmatimonadota bacterium]